MSVKRNVVANYLGQGWRVLVGLAFVPIYIRYLGIEAYGLIGVFGVLQVWLGLLDVGMRPALVREMARFTGGQVDVQSIRDLLRSTELITLATAVLVAVGIWAASGWLATDWLKADKLPLDVVTRAFAVMGLVAASSFMETLYVSSISGLQRQVLQNIIASVMATVRALGAVGVLIWVSNSITAFFLWQALVSLATVALLAWGVYGSLPSPPRPARFSWPALTSIWRFAAGMMAVTILSALASQIDKVLLSRLISLESFAHYMLAGTVAGSLYMVTSPITASYYPRFTELATPAGEGQLCRLYHQSAQLVTVLSGSAAVVLVIFSERIITVWTGDPSLAQHVAPPLRILALGTMIHSFLWSPYHVQLAYGWTSLSIKINIVAVLVLLPAIFWVAPRYGAVGAATAWLTLNLGYLTFAIQLMHRRLLVTEKWRWYLQDVAAPLAVAFAVGLLCRFGMPAHLGRVQSLLALLVVGGCVATAAAMTAPLVREQVIARLPPRLRPAELWKAYRSR